MADLLPCPFCGWDAVFGYRDGDFCIICIGCGSSSADHGLKHKAVAAWNTRSPAVIVEPEAGSLLADETK